MLSGIKRTGERLADLRERALLNSGTASTMRRSNLAALEVANFQIGTSGVRVTIRQAMPDQKAASAVIATLEGRRLKAGASLQGWLHLADITSGDVSR